MQEFKKKTTNYYFGPIQTIIYSLIVMNKILLNVVYVTQFLIYNHFCADLYAFFVEGVI